MSERSFLDTNILIYADDQRNSSKRRVAEQLILRHRDDRTGVVSIQVLQEYFVAATRELGVSATTARRKIELVADFEVVIPSVTDILAAIDLHRLHTISFWDALIIQSARQSGCRVILSENMQAARLIDGIRIVNPFARTP